MADPRLYDSLSMEEWQRRRRAGLLNGEPRPPSRVRWEADQPPPRPPRQSQADAHAAARVAGRSVDSQRTEVFRRGPDGKLHPIPGWRTTGPHAYGAWSRNIDWQGVGDDFATMTGRVAGFLAPVGPKGAGSPAPKTGLEGVALFGSLYDMARELRDDLAKAQAPRRPDR